jgi:hypothetical protein
MPIPNLTPPTDNLYKFLAISGLIFTIFCIVYPTSFLTSNSSTLTTLLTNSRVLEMDINLLETRVYEQQAQIPTDEIVIQYQQQIHDIRRRMIEVDELVNQELRKQNFINQIRQILYIFSLLGAAITGTAFSLWYYKVQKYQDKILEVEVLSKVKSLDTSSKTSEPNQIKSSSEASKLTIVNEHQTTPLPKKLV